MSDLRQFGIDIPDHKVLILYNHINGEQLVFTKRSKVYFIGFRVEQIDKFKLIPVSISHDLAHEEFTMAIDALSYPNFKLK